MSNQPAPGLDRCEIVWWRGYVKGRFQAYASSASRPPVLIDESPAIWHRSEEDPDPSDEALEALRVLVDRLAEKGWVDAGHDAGTWFGLVFGRPAPSLVPTPDAARGPGLAQVHLELQQARAEIERERQGRLEAEAESRRLAAAVPVNIGPSSRPFVIAGYVLAIAYAAAIFLFGFHSLYAAAVAALTVAAVSIAVACWLVTHRSTRTARRYELHAPGERT